MSDNTAQNPQQTEQPLSHSMETSAALVAERCFKDKAFGERFLANPADALAQEKYKLGHRQVHVHENDARNWHIVLPNLSARETLSKYSADELKAMSDADMRRLSGGEIAMAAIGLTIMGVSAGTATAVAVTGAGLGAHYARKKDK